MEGREGWGEERREGEGIETERRYIERKTEKRYKERESMKKGKDGWEEKKLIECRSH